MSTIPTPFIGGAGGPPVDRALQEELAPPFFTEDAGPAIGQDPLDAPEPSVGDQRIELAPTGDVAVHSAEPEELIDLVFTESPEAGVEPETEELSTPPLTPDVAAQEAGFGLDTSGVPDFLAGPDAIGPDEPLAAKPAAPQRPATPEEVSARASQLLDGELGDWIQELAAEIGAADVTAISRAFAAGYLAARMQGEN